MEKNVFRGILILIIAVLCCYFLFGIVPSFLFDDDYSVESVEECVYNDITPFEGIALRTETVLTAGSNYSMMIHEVADGERAFHRGRRTPFALPEPLYTHTYRNRQQCGHIGCLIFGK